MGDSDAEETSSDAWKMGECWMQHSQQEKEVLQQLYAQIGLEATPDLDKVADLLRSPVFERVPVDHMCYSRFFNGLEAACFKGNIELAHLLLTRGADVHGKRRNSKSRYWQPLHLVCQSRAPTSDVLQIARLLVSHGASVSDHDGNDALPLTHAVDGNHAAVVEFLLSKGADPNGWFYGTPPLILACAQGDAKVHPAVILSLLAAGADPNIPSFNQDCLRQACFKLSPEKLLLLLAYRVRVGRGALNLCDVKSLMGVVLKKSTSSSGSSTDAECKESYSTILCLLLAAGLKFASGDKKWIENEIAAIDFEENLGLGIWLIEETLKLFSDFLFTPRQLSVLCRLKIRSCVPPDIDVNVKRLPLPESVQRFLQFGDIAHRVTYCL